MSLLAALGTLSYNGYDFDGTTKIHVNVDFIKDDSGRTVVAHQHTIRASTIVQGDSGTNTETLSIRKKLGEQGRGLVFSNRGFGNDLIVNSPTLGPLRDVRWGPVPNVIRWEPIASFRACDLEWEVVTTVAVCDQGADRFTGIMALNYDVSFDVDERGYTRRTITGYIEVAQTRLGRSVPDSADLYLSAYKTSVPQGFHRSESRHLSLNKSRLDFTVTDKEIPSPNAYPKGIVDIQCRHRVGWKRGSGLPRNVITAEIETAADFPTAHALVVFSALANQRLAIAKAAIGRGSSTSGGQSNHKADVLIDEFTIEEDLFSHRSSFTLGYRIPTTLKQFMFDCGLWTPTDTNWPEWHLSIQQAQSQRGYAGLNHLPGDDRINDLCAASQQLGYQQRQNQQQPQSNPSLPSVKNDKPDAKNSWLRYWHRASIHRRRPVVRQRLLQETDSDPGTFDLQATNGIVYPQRGGEDDIIQEGGQGSYYALVYGRAARAGHEIPRPKYDKIGTANATEIEGEFHQAITSNWFGLPIYQAVWTLLYALPHSPGSVKLLPNPMEFLNADGTAS